MRITGELLRYGVIGGIVTIFYGMLLVFCVEALALGVVVANALTFIVANLCAYFLHSRFAFRRAVSFLGYLRFFSSYVLSYALSLIIAAFAEWLGWHYLVGFVLISSVVPIFSFILLKFWVFDTNQEEEKHESK